MSHWVRSTARRSDVGADTAEALAQACARPGRIATLVLPGDAAWDEAGETLGASRPAAGFAAPDAGAIDNAARVLRSGEPTLLLLGGKALRERGLELAGRIAARAGCKLATRFFNARVERGAGRVAGHAPRPMRSIRRSPSCAASATSSPCMPRSRSASSPIPASRAC